MPVAMETLIAAAQAAADVAGTVIRPFFRSGSSDGFDTTLKADLSPVTIADRTAELAMRAVFGERFPEHGIMGEEFGLQHPDARFRWVLDPIDGTRAFITGRPVFGTLIALLDDGAPVLGLIDQPITGERWIGAAGQPTRFRGPFGGKAGCRRCPRLADAEMSCTSPEMLNETETVQWQRLASQVRRISWGGDCYAYGLLALGQIDIVAEADMKIWDWAALVPVIEGAGGSVTDWEGQPLRDNLNRCVLAVGNPALTAEAVRLLTG